MDDSEPGPEQRNPRARGRARGRVRVRGFLRERFTAGDVAIHAGIVVVLILAYAAPIPYEAFLFRPGVNGWRGAYLSVVGHATVVHLAGNVASFLVLSGLSLCLLRGASRRRLYYVSVLVLFLIVPPLSSTLVARLLERTAPAMIGTYRGAGFSLLTAALLGLLAVAIAVHQTERLRGSIPAAISSLGPFALAVAVPGYRYGAPIEITILAGLLGLAFLGYAAAVVRATIRAESTTLDVALSIVATCTFLGAASDLFPPDPGIVGVELHFIGFVCGFALVWLTWLGWVLVGSTARGSG